jgi:signal transduction histidine kinase/ActR/RegA family two-component response regulator
MDKGQRKPPDAAALRRRAEARLHSAPSQTGGLRTAGGTQRLLHELQVHQVELELQNEELRQTRDALEASLERVTALYDFAPVGYASLDRAGTIRSLNLAGAALLGGDRAGIVGTPFHRALSPDTRSAFHAFLATVFDHGGKAACEVTLRPDGSPPLCVRIEALATEAGDECRVALLDVTERTQAAAALRQAHADLEERVQARTAELSSAVQSLARQSAQLHALASELTLAEQRERKRLATILHDEHQQLLAAARLKVGLLARAGDARAQEGCREATALLDEALAHSRSLTHELSPPVLAMGGLAPALEWLARWMEEKHQLKVEMQLDATAVPDTEGLIYLLFQATRELLFNVVKHAKVDTACVACGQQDGHVQITVSDTGAGFDPATLRLTGGTAGGFGLLSVRQRLELLGGGLEIASAPGRGSRCTLWAPLRHTRPDNAPATIAPAKAPPGIPSEGKSRPVHVLVVDDHRVMREGLKQLLTAEPDLVVVGEAADGQQAVELTRQLWPDVVIMDISMPTLNGIEATRVISAEYPTVRVIGLSMFEAAEQETAMREAGAVAFLSKSGPVEVLLAAIRECVQPERLGTEG